MYVLALMFRITFHRPEQIRNRVDEFRMESSTGWTRVMQY